MRYVVGLSQTVKADGTVREGLFVLNSKHEWCMCDKSTPIKKLLFPLFDNSDIAELFVRGLNKCFSKKFNGSGFKYRAYVLKLDAPNTPCKILTDGESFEDLDKISGLKVQYYRALWR